MKRLFSYLKRSIVVMALLVAFMSISGGTALAVTYDRENYLGLGEPGTFWGAAYLTASEVVDWLEVKTTGVEDGWITLFRWDATNYQQNVSQVGQSGSGAYFQFPQPPGSYLASAGSFWWPGGSDSIIDLIPHPWGWP